MTKNISNAMLEHSVCIMLGFLGPFQYVGVVTVVIEILRSVGTIKQDDIPNDLVDFNIAMEVHTTAYREVETPRVVENIAKSSIQIDESTEELPAYFFYTKTQLFCIRFNPINV